jgi:dihydrofolate reductase
MRLVLITFISQDGVVQAPGGPNEDRDGGFEHGGWSVPFWGDDIGAAIDEWFGNVEAFLLGRRTYEIFSSAWPQVTDPDDPVASNLNSLPKYVASRTLDVVSWNGAQLLRGDVVQAVEELKRQPGGELQIHGSGSLAQTLIAHGLVDEYRLITHPVVLGKGKRLFGDGARPATLRRIEHRDLATGGSIDVFEAAGDVEVGSFEIVDGQNPGRAS